MTVAELHDDTVELAFPAMKELRPHLADVAEFRERVREQRAENYRIVGSFDRDGAVVAVAGFRVLNNLVSGRMLYVDDLSTLPAVRRKGHASALLTWLDKEARRLHCAEVHLDSATHRHPAHRRYLASGFDITAFHFSKSTP